MKIEYFWKNVYGVPTMYVKDDEKARKIMRLTGRKSLSQDHMDLFEDLFGVTFIEVLAPRV